MKSEDFQTSRRVETTLIDRLPVRQRVNFKLVLIMYRMNAISVLWVCLSVRERIPITIFPNCNKFSVHILCGRGLAFLCSNVAVGYVTHFRFCG